MMAFIGIWAALIAMGLITFVVVGATHHAIVKEKFQDAVLGIFSSMLLLWCCSELALKATAIKLPGTIRTTCKQREWVKIPKEANGIKYEVEEVRCKEYYPSWIYIDGEWKEMVEDKKNEANNK